MYGDEEGCYCPNSDKIEFSLVLDRILLFCEGLNAFLDIITGRKLYFN
jgi:hypothetical protein